MRKHIIKQYLPDYQPAYVANGLVGLRIGQNPLIDGTALLSGFVGLHDKHAVEAIAPAPYPVGGDIVIDGCPLSARPDLIHFREQIYDFSCGELTSRFDFTVQDKTANVEVVTFCSRTMPTLVLQEVRIAVKQACKLDICSSMNPSELPGKALLRTMPVHNKKGVDAVLHWQGRGALSTCGAAFITEFMGDDLIERQGDGWGCEQDVQMIQYSIHAKPEKEYILRQIGSLVPGIMHQEPHWQAVRMLGLAKWHGFDKVRDDNRKAWQELWKGRIKILGADDNWQDIVDAAFFYLHSTIHSSTPCSIAPFGLGHDSYSGHVFWDTESFMFFPTLLTAPESARAILEYRSRMLPAAKFNAALNGYKGIQYPWQSGNYGCEVTRISAGAAAGSGSQHINMDVALAFAKYVHATDDDIFLHEQAWPVFKGVADWIISRVDKTDRGYEILHITGIDETMDNVNNDSYTNITCKIVLSEAIHVSKVLGYKPRSSWIDVEKKLYIPIDSESNVILKNDGYKYNGGVCYPDPLMAYFPYGYKHNEKVDAATKEFYVNLAHTFIGQPMMSSFFGVFAARMGDRKLSRELFDSGNLNFIKDTFMQFTEFAPHIQGWSKTLHSNLAYSPSWTRTPFVTQAGGLLTGLLLGLPGIQIGSGELEQWCQHPVAMPEGWDGIEVERVWLKNKPVHLIARHGDKKATIDKI